ncbi:HvfC/BufC N-terminal domain-containing protein [Variovorax ginsengisoli]|uniref:DNA-binding domain-containing protein n=1 Tax=Variovorax ginsengisoli TaxID=363844 RepID=A0ABT8S7B6_9BURK|nr:DNA-binding domain-containing protein [Variovorax ginsengisoli]MDN8615193.1 DNA-binding domain-containing protein [Variovorax ginsengisoli]MDO1534363.1 DNA-binding domain-containing protein [Variovorax ginsengisoli]
MGALPEVQARVMDALLHDGAAATALIRPTASLSARQRLQVYRHNMFESLTAALGAVYPVVARLVGDGFFRQAAKAFIVAHPSRSGNLQDFGGAFAGFLRAWPVAAGLPYLPDVATLEWALHHAYHEVELPALTLERLAQVPAAEQAGLRLRLQPSARFVGSRYPLLRIWQANQPEALDDESTISLDEGGVDLLVVQCALEIEFRHLGPAEGRWLRALAGQAGLAEATGRAMDADPAFDLMAALARHLGLGLFTWVST